MTPATGLDPGRTKLIYERDATRYLRSLPLEHFMEATAQATQRKITVESFDLIQLARPDVQCFSELLIQYPLPGRDPDEPVRVVPDNMVVVHPEPIKAERSFMLPLQPVGPFLVVEYVSQSNQRKDYDDSYRKYERDLRVPYYLLFYPDNEELTLFRLAGESYTTVTPNAAGRLAIPPLELEVGLLNGWVRFWFRGELIPVPTELQQQINALTGQIRAENEARLAAEQRASTAEQRASTAERRATASEQIAESERQARIAVEAELARLREELGRVKGTQP
jgi:hypothetical protein